MSSSGSSIDVSAKLEIISRLERDHRSLLETSLAEFARAAWPILEPTTRLQWNWHLDLLCEYLTLASRGECRRLIINVPPRSMKSLLCTVLYPAWRWCTAPERRFMSVSYADELSTDHSVYRRNVLQSRWYRSHWGGRVRFCKDQNLKTQYENTRRGGMYATSITGAATGKGCDELIVDDPQNPKKAYSDPEREGANRTFDATFRSRLNNPSTGVIVLIMQRLHEADLTGHILAKEPGVWTHIKLPAEAEHDEQWIFPISGRVVERHVGETLWPDRLPADVLAELKTALGSWAYAGQYQQNPAPLEGGIVKRRWLQFYRELPASRGTWVQSWDCAFKDTRESDYVVGQVWFHTGGAYYLVDQVRERMDFVRTKQAIRQMSIKHPKATAKLIEDRANGPAVISSLRAEIDGIIPIEPRDSKQARLHAVSPLFEAGNVFFPDVSTARWAGDLVEELTRFPNAANDDQVDACTQALLYMRQRMGGILGWYRERANVL
jgi:predicted phage terminase large subunit-like protein